MFLLEERYRNNSTKEITKKIVGEFETEEEAFKCAREMKYKLSGAVSSFNINAMNDKGYVCSYMSFIQNTKKDSWHIDYYILSQN